ncbi:MAG: ABC transporter ATP-binding protein [Chloroflexi bacterium]|nr:ABC transporter ATP-binding protein [Chloroflexota bacterium]
MEPILLTRHLSKTFHRQGQPLPVLHDINIEIAPGAFTAIIGPSGCGKSTLLRILADLEQPSSGEVQVNGKSPRQARLDRDYGIVFQTPVLHGWRTVRQNIMLPLEIMGLPAGERVEQMIRLVKLEEYVDYYPHQLSGGMQQRAAIARALVNSPRLLFMDEPFGALDEITREHLNLELLRIWQETGTTIFFITHSISEAVFLSTQLLVMSPRPGQIERQITIELPTSSHHLRDALTRQHPHFLELTTQVRLALRLATDT